MMNKSKAETDGERERESIRPGFCYKATQKERDQETMSSPSHGWSL